jgi:hypothetical protein
MVNILRRSSLDLGLQRAGGDDLSRAWRPSPAPVDTEGGA